MCTDSGTGEYVEGAGEKETVIARSSEAISDWIGTAIYLASTMETFDFDNVFVGHSTGEVTSCILSGDNNKPVVLFLQNAAEFYQIDDYQAGINIHNDNQYYVYHPKFLYHLLQLFLEYDY